MKSKSRFLLMAILGLLTGFLALFYGEPKPQVSMMQYDHSKHRGLACEVCHKGVETQTNATVPDSALCARCHNTSPDKSVAALEIWRITEKGNVSRWPVSYRLPSHVYFSHRRHVAGAKIQCVTCHGDMTTQKSPVVRPLKTLDMDRCMDCHKRENVVDDCAQCHK